MMSVTTSPGNKTVQKRYNARGLMETVTEPSGQTTTFHYDSMGRVDDSVDAVGTIDHAYDEAGQSDTITQGATVIDRDHDALGRLTKYQHGTDYTLQWQYHDPQNAVSLVYPDGVKKVRYDFDNRGRLSKVTDWAGRITRYQYDDAGRLRWTHRDYNGTRREVKYDAASQITAIEERDKNGGAIALFRYLEHWDNGQIKKTFTLPLPQTQALTLPIMTYNADNQLLTWKASAAAAAQNVVHDADGNTTTGPLPDLSSPAAAARWAGFGFDARNRLTSVTATGVNSTHSYDAENLRTSVTENGVTSQWMINPHGLSGLSEALVRVKNGVTTCYVYGLGLLYEEEEAATPVVRTYHFDRQGSTAALTATDGLTVTDRFEYAAYGERTHRTGSTDTPFQFNGFFGVQTDASGLLYMRARYYNVETRRFQSADPMGFAESSNFYWFANADPVSLVDPFGLGASDGGGFWRGVKAVFSPVAQLAKILVTDVAALAVGQVMKVYAVGQAVIGQFYPPIMIDSAGKQIGFGGRLRALLLSVVIPNYGLYNGAGVGTDQWGIDGRPKPMNAVDWPGVAHDRGMDLNDSYARDQGFTRMGQVHGQWVRDQLSLTSQRASMMTSPNYPMPVSITPAGPLGWAYRGIGIPAFGLFSLLDNSGVSTSAHE